MKIWVFTIFLFTSSIVHVNADNHKLIYMVSTPRSLSTAFLRMMEARGDCEIYNEPSMWAYDKIYYKDMCTEWFRPGAPQSFQEVKRHLYQDLKKRHVFVKEMCYAAHEFLQVDEPLVSDPNVHFLFLVRDPHHSAISMYKKLQYAEEVSAEEFSELVGQKQLWRVYERVKKHSPNSVKILFAQELYRNPMETILALCNHLKIPFLKHSLKWKSYDDHFTGEHNWHEIKKTVHSQHWHGDAMKSSAFVKPTEYIVDTSGQPTFSEVENSEHRERVRKAYHDNIEYYKKFLKAAQQ